MPKIRFRQPPGRTWLRNRELGITFPLGHENRFFKTLYCNMKPVTSWGHGEHLSSAMHGGVFNLEYSPDGSLLLAACEKKSILMFDPLCRRLIHSIDNAHNDCVNCVRFLDQRMFATCSDDSTVALWDARNLKQRIRTLKGHSNWVKNIEYSASDGLLLTSGFDGSIYTWDINSFTENSFLYNRVFHTNGLMRTRLTPDASKMLICTTSGYLIIIHNLRLSTLSQDLAGFKPNMYRLMQLSQTTIPVAANFTHLFGSSRIHNRVEFLTDFPVGDDAEVISSLQVHPQGWCALSRNVSNGEKSEWTCVHDIQERETSTASEMKETDDLPSPESIEDDYEVSQQEQQPQPHPQPQGSRSGITSSFVIDSARRVRIVQTLSDVRTNSFESTDAGESVRALRTNNWQDVRRMSLRQHSRGPRTERHSARSNAGLINNATNENGSRRSEEEEAAESVERENVVSPDETPAYGVPRVEYEEYHQDDYAYRQLTRQQESRVENNAFAPTNVELHVSSTDVWEALLAIREARLRREVERGYNPTADRQSWLNRLNNPVNMDIPRSSHTVVIVGERGRLEQQPRQPQNPMYAIPRNHKIHQNVSRLTHYIEEPNVGSGYIKELCFSSDGRLICSPFGYGVRFLGFAKDCSELSNCIPPDYESVKLVELATNISHSDIVVSTKFSPRHCLLVSGCLGGKIVWHQPVV